MQRADARLRHEAFLEPTVVNIGIINNDTAADGRKTSRLPAAALGSLAFPRSRAFAVIGFGCGAC